MPPASHLRRNATSAVVRGRAALVDGPSVGDRPNNEARVVRQARVPRAVDPPRAKLVIHEKDRINVGGALGADAQTVRTPPKAKTGVGQGPRGRPRPRTLGRRST